MKLIKGRPGRKRGTNPVVSSEHAQHYLKERGRTETEIDALLGTAHDSLAKALRRHRNPAVLDVIDDANSPGGVLAHLEEARLRLRVLASADAADTLGGRHHAVVRNAERALVLMTTSIRRIVKEMESDKTRWLDIIIMGELDNWPKGTSRELAADLLGACNALGFREVDATEVSALLVLAWLERPTLISGIAPDDDSNLAERDARSRRHGLTLSRARRARHD